MNPYFAASWQPSTFNLTTIYNTQELEEVIYLPLQSFKTGSVISAKVTTQMFEAMRTNVRYDWLF